MKQENKLLMILRELSAKDFISVDDARNLSTLEWRGLIDDLNNDLRIEAESFFFFAEALIEDVDEGFINSDYEDFELAKKCKTLTSKLNDTF